MKTLTYGSIEASGPVMVFLHGFPGLRSKQNRDFAEKAVKELGGFALVPLYQGLGQAPGIFRFGGCLSEVRALVSALARDVGAAGRKLHLIGHSWGGFMTLKFASELGPELVAGATVLSPLLNFSAVGDLRLGYKDAKVSHPECDLGEMESFVSDYDEVSGANDVAALVANFPAEIKVLFLQAKNDPITQDAIAEVMLAKFPVKPEFHKVDVDHSFLGPGRAEVGERLVALIGSLKA